MKVTPRGQVTIPAAIRHELGIGPGTEVELTVSGEEIVLRRARTREARGKRLIASMRGKARSGMTTDEIMALVRDW